MRNKIKMEANRILSMLKYFSLFEVSFDRDNYLGFSVAGFGEYDDTKRFLFQVSNAFGCWYIDLMWYRITPKY